MAFGDLFKAKPQGQPSNQGQGNMGMGVQGQGNGNQGQGNNNNGGQNNSGVNTNNTGLNDPGNQGGGAPGSTNNNNNNGQGQGNNQNAGNQGQQTGLDRFGKLWDTPSSEGNQAPSFTLDPKVLNDVASQQDFMKGIDPQLMERATSGDVKALMELMGKVSQNSYRTSIEHAGLLTDKFVGAREAHSSKNVASGVRKELTTHALSTVPNFKNPVIQKQLSATAERLQAMHPDASPQEIAQMTTEYFAELTAAIQDPSKAANNQGGAKDSKGPRGEEFWNNYWAAAGQEES